MGPLAGSELVPGWCGKVLLKADGVCNDIENSVSVDDNCELVMHGLFSLLLAGGCVVLLLVLGGYVYCCSSVFQMKLEFSSANSHCFAGTSPSS